MFSGIEFVATALAILIVWMLWSLRDVNLKEYFKTDTGKGILKGIVLAVTIPLLLVLLSMMFGCSGKFNNGASVYAGLDYTKKISPMCDDDGNDTHTTSNLGLRYHLYQSEDSRFRTNLKYTHHSCAFSEDERGYDGAGVELEYKLW
jgi:hypothetical protein